MNGLTIGLEGWLLIGVWAAVVVPHVERRRFLGHLIRRGP
jgi:hypothetical protein